MLNPDLFYNNPKIEFDLEVNNGMYVCIRKLVSCPEMQQNILNEIPIYKSGSGLFGDDFAIKQRSTLAPAQWWRMYGHQTPNLQQLAIKILSLTCSASGCERNWSVFEQVHSKKRNRLGYKKMHDLVYVKYNQQLFERYNIRDEIDPISLDDIDECNEWMVGEMDEDLDGGEDLVFENDPNLTWQNVYDASRIGEPTTNTRQQTRKRKAVAKNKKTNTMQQKKKRKLKVVQEEDEEIEEDEVEVEDLASEEEEGEVGEQLPQPKHVYTRKRKALAPTSSSTTSKGKDKVVQEEEEEDEEDEDWLQLPPQIQNELLNFAKDLESEEEEGEGDAPLVNDLENDYVGVGEED